MGKPEAVHCRHNRRAAPGPSARLGGKPPDHHRLVCHDSHRGHHPDNFGRHHADADQRGCGGDQDQLLPPRRPREIRRPRGAVASRSDVDRGSDDRSSGGVAVRVVCRERAAEHVAQHHAATAAELGLDAHPAHGHGEGHRSICSSTKTRPHTTCCGAPRTTRSTGRC